MNSWGITKDDYDKKLQELKDCQLFQCLRKMMIVAEHVREACAAHHLHGNTIRKTVMFIQSNGVVSIT